MINVDDLTIGQVKELSNLLNTGIEPTQKPTNPMIGKYCIARCYSAGVHAGEVVSVDNENVILKDSRRLWSWKASDGLALSGLANNGMESGKVDTKNDFIYLTGVCELIPCSDKAKDSINEK